MELPIVTQAKDLQILNEALPILVNESGKSMLVSELQPENAKSPISVKESGSETLFKDRQC